MDNQQIDEELRYPIGRFDNSLIDSSRRAEYIDSIETAPEKLRAAIDGLSAGQLESEYRPGSWSVRQLIHHFAESHMNGFYRFKMTLTNDVPIIVPYDESDWAALGDRVLPIDPSLQIIDGVHARLTAMFRDLSDDQFERKANNLATGEWTVDGMLALYAWHSIHHTAHITGMRERNGW